MTKAIKEPKVQNAEHDLLLKRTMTTQRYNTMFKSRINLRKAFEVRILQFGERRMIGDSECVMNLPYQTSVSCVSQEGKAIAIQKSELLQIQSYSEEQWRHVV